MQQVVAHDGGPQGRYYCTSERIHCHCEFALIPIRSTSLNHDRLGYIPLEAATSIVYNAQFAKCNYRGGGDERGQAVKLE